MPLSYHFSEFLFRVPVLPIVCEAEGKKLLKLFLNLKKNLKFYSEEIEKKTVR